MQTVGRIAGRTVGATHHKRNRKQELAQRRAKKEGSGAERWHPHFLSQRIAPIGPSSVTRRGGRGKEYNYVTRANYLYLRDSALNYARLMGKELGHEPDGNLGACIADLYRKLAELEPSLHLNLEPEGNRLRFVFWHRHQWGERTLYWLCLNVLESLSPKMREAVLLFFRKLRTATGIQTLREGCDLEWVLEWIAENADQYDNEEDRAADMLIIGDYSRGGVAFTLMEDVQTPPEPDADLTRMLSRLRPRAEKEKALLGVLREGLQFTEPDTPSIFSYEYNPHADEDLDEGTIEMERIVRFIYDCDMVCDNLTEMINNEVNGGLCETLPCTWLTLAPDTDRVFTADTFPEEFFAWLSKLMECINDY